MQLLCLRGLVFLITHLTSPNTHGIYKKSRGSDTAFESSDKASSKIQGKTASQRCHSFYETRSVT